MSRMAARWGDNDTYFGPFTFARDRTYRTLSITLASGDDDSRKCRFRVSAFGRTMLVALPDWVLRPERKKVAAKFWDEATIQRLGRDWYWDETPREYGVSVYDGHLSIYYGRQSHDSSTEQRWGYFLPWTQWRHVRHSLYGLDGALFAHLPANARWNTPERAEEERLTEACPRAIFAFKDFDGETLTATTKIEEREWRLGTSWCRWLSLFAKPKVRRSLDIWFSGETGKRKGSWKGGTLGTGINMEPGELHESAFRRYCAEHAMTFVGPA